MRVTIIRIDRERSEKNPPTGGCMPRTGLEPARVASLPPQSSASANSATWAWKGGLYAGVGGCRERGRGGASSSTRVDRRQEQQERDRRRRGFGDDRARRVCGDLAGEGGGD